MKLEKRLLIHDLLDEQGESRRAATLLAGANVLRRKRWRRVAVRTIAVVAVLVIAALSIQLRTTPHRPRLSSNPSDTPTVHYLTDDQLLALFPDTPVGLARVGDKKVLLFPRPGDQERFVGQF